MVANAKSRVLIFQSTKATKSVGVKDTARDRLMLKNCATGLHLEDHHVSKEKAPYTSPHRRFQKCAFPASAAQSPKPNPDVVPFFLH
ncbi:hypothetical protein SNOG_13391 [Parastagonospora nodorum SN15]|uniref:Uncharacterized protein n=1 Tax=Phaeosphaeria nodorum (strain SN15 / ATCC MYA-4574 / FGSC 10173) TaxID=321614 RepID=Q0U4C3_PHANO|nr:hypothetical protein SNOG_13391 [Parastagonospora nodorum SN15]EAT79275.1 hypothetical protein SNOG_13391 [Parastagonospora nodorum SN15]